MVAVISGTLTIPPTILILFISPRPVETMCGLCVSLNTLYASKKPQVIKPNSAVNVVHKTTLLIKEMFSILSSRRPKHSSKMIGDSTMIGRLFPMWSLTAPKMGAARMLANSNEFMTDVAVSKE